MLQALDVIYAPGLADVAVFTSSGTWFRPDGVRSAWVRLVGGGGGGGGASATAAGVSACGGGGGGGGYAEAIIPADQLTASVTITIGAGGAAGTAGANGGGAGGTTSFGALVVASGGAGGSGGAQGSLPPVLSGGGIGGVGLVGDFLVRGGDGATGVSALARVCGEGRGGASRFGGEQRATASGVTAAGGTGQPYGGGGTGGLNSPSQTAVAGGAGAAGLIVVVTVY